jgi:hypothetical protein
MLALVTVNLRLEVTRGEDDRLSGTVRTDTQAEARVFSGTLELMRVFEELVPAHDPAERRITD